jgi:hypothetical protein
MKKVIILLAFIAFAATAASQSPWEGFFKPFGIQSFDKRVAVKGLVKAVNPSVWMFRPAVELSAMKLSYDKDTKQWNSSSFTSVGMGIGYQHYITVDEVPYNNFGFNLLMLYNAVPTETAEAGISLAGTVSALKFIDVGVGYDFQMKVVFGLMGIKYNF